MTPEQEKLLKWHLWRIWEDIASDILNYGADGPISSIPQDEFIDVVLDQSADDHREKCDRQGHPIDEQTRAALVALHEMKFDDMTKLCAKLFPQTTFGW
jgi:hypothetical protein